MAAPESWDGACPTDTARPARSAQHTNTHTHARTPPPSDRCPRQQPMRPSTFQRFNNLSIRMAAPESWDGACPTDTARPLVLNTHTHAHHRHPIGARSNSPCARRRLNNLSIRTAAPESWDGACPPTPPARSCSTHTHTHAHHRHPTGVRANSPCARGRFNVSTTFRFVAAPESWRGARPPARAQHTHTRAHTTAIRSAPAPTAHAPVNVSTFQQPFDSHGGARIVGRRLPHRHRPPALVYVG